MPLLLNLFVSRGEHDSPLSAVSVLTLKSSTPVFLKPLSLGGSAAENEQFLKTNSKVSLRPGLVTSTDPTMC